MRKYKITVEIDEVSKRLPRIMSHNDKKMHEENNALERFGFSQSLLGDGYRRLTKSISVLKLLGEVL